MQFIWERLRNRNEDLGYVGVFEKPDTELMKMIVDHYTDEPSVVEVSEQLMTKRRVVMENDGQQYQEYKQKDLAAFAPDTYHGSTKIGRAYTNSIFQRLHAPILNTIYKTTHIGLDINASYSSMLVSAFRDLELSFFREYASSPAMIYDAFGDIGVSRGNVKKLVNGTICAWPAMFNDPTVGDMVELGRHELVQHMRGDVSKMAMAMQSRYPGFVEMVRRKCESDGKGEHVEGTALFFLASDMEHSVMRAVIHHLYGKPQMSNVVWKYDGILIPMAMIAGRRHDEVVNELTDVVMEKLGVHVAFKVEDLGAKSFGICINPEDRNREDGLDAYERWKACFERTFAVVKNPPVFMMFRRGGRSWTDLNKAGFEHVTATEPKQFIKQWHEDPSKRMYTARDFVPPPLQIAEGYLNTYKGIAAAELPEVEGVDISRYLRHVDVLVGNLNGEHPEYAEYLHNLLAYKFQSPGLKWRVMPIILSAQGVGKDLWFDFISDLMGDYNCVKGNGISDFVEKKSGKLEGKLLCCFQEMGTRKVDRECEEQLKTYITNRHMTLERKHVNEVIVTNVVDFIGFSNKPDAVVISADDRRFFIVTADSTYMQNEEYIYPLLAFFHDDKNKRAVYDFYMERDIIGFDPSSARPKTEIQKEMIESQVSHMELFLRDAMKTFLDAWRMQDDTMPDYKRAYVMKGHQLRVFASIVGEHWMEYAKANNFKNHESKRSMDQFFGKMTREMLLRSDQFKSEGVDKLVAKAKVRGGQHVYLFDHHGIERYLASLFKDEEEEEEPPAKRRRGERKAEWNPNRVPRYQVREGGEVVFQSDDLEEINKELGEAYIDEERGVLVHQQLNNKEIDIADIWSGDHKYVRVEMKFPFYRRDRTA